MADLLTIFRTDIGKVRVRLKGVRDELEKARRRREELHALPPPVDEICEILTPLVDERALRWKAELGRRISNHIRDLHGDLSPGVRTLTVVQQSQHAHDIEGLIAHMFPGQIRAALKAAIQGLGIQHGPPRAERLAELAKLETQIAGLEEQDKTINAELDALRAELKT